MRTSRSAPRAALSGTRASTSTPSYQAVNRTIREIFPDVLVVPGLMVAATDSRNYLDVTDNIFRFSPVRATAEDLKLAAALWPLVPRDTPPSILHPFADEEPRPL